MTQRFNAPPGWDVPPDFVPTAGWQPDPSWPPAPQGWTYWVEDGVSAAPAPVDAVPSYGTPPGSPAYGSAPAASYSAPQGAYGAPVGAYGSTAAGSAQGVVAQGQRSNARKQIVSGSIMLAAGLVLTIGRLLVDGDIWFFPVILVVAGAVSLIRGLRERKKADQLVDIGAMYGAGQGNRPGGF